MKPIVVVGSLNMDVTAYLDRWVQPGETLLARDGAVSMGGKGGNQAVAAARLGAEVRMIAAVGDDGFGADIDDRLRAETITANLVRPANCHTGMALIDVSDDGSNMIRLIAGANAQLDASAVRAHAAAFKGAGIVLLQNEVPLAASLQAARLGRAAGALVIMDPAPAPVTPWTPGEFAVFDIVTPNAHEASLILGWDVASLADATEAALQLRKFGLRGAVVTMGALGAAWSIDDQSGQISPHAVKVVDTVAAGDCFNGGLAVALAQVQDLPAAMAMACDVASLATLKRGAAISAPYRADLLNFQLQHQNVHRHSRTN